MNTLNHSGLSRIDSGCVRRLTYQNDGGRNGFTLLEIVVVVGILSLLMGLGLSALVPFKERREVLSNARNVASLFTQVQVKASAVEVPGSCDLSGVGEFELVLSGGSISLLVNDPSGLTCKSDDGVLVMSGGSEFVLDESVIFTTPFGTSELNTVSICDYGVQYDLTISENGSVSEPAKSLTPSCL